MKKTISQAICLALCLAMLLCFPLTVKAESALGHTVTLSSDSVNVGEIVTVTVSLTGYTADTEENIRGVQIDVTNVDSTILSVEDKQSLIVDPGAMSNKASYSEANKRVRLLYANISGDYLDKPWSDVFQIKFKIKETVTESGSITLPVTVKIATATENITLKSNCVINYTAEPLTVFNVDITWGSLSYSYSDGTWNPSTHEYEGSGWTCAENSNAVTVANNGDDSVQIGFTYTAKSDYREISGSFKDSGNNDVSSFTLASGNSRTTYLALSGKPNGELSSTAVGQVTVNVGEVS